MGAIAVFSIMIAILILTIKRNKELNRENKTQERSINQRDNNASAYSTLQDKVTKIKKESKDDKKNRKNTSRANAFNELPKR